MGNSNEMKFGCIIATKVKERKSNSILNAVFSGWSSITNLSTVSVKTRYKKKRMVEYLYGGRVAGDTYRLRSFEGRGGRRSDHE